MTIKGLEENLDVLRGGKATTKAGSITKAARLDARAPQERLRYVIDT